MKTFEDLKFSPHPFVENGDQAIIHFDNGYGVSVLVGNEFYSNGIDTYEVAILKDGNITYETPITNDVLGYLSKKEVTKVMKQVQQL